MSVEPPSDEWKFYRFGLLVTGRSEAEFLPTFLRSLTTEAGNCTFQVIRCIPQRSPVTSEKKQLKMIGSNKALPTLDVEQIGLPARNFLTSDPNTFVILLDDLEHDRRPHHQQVFDRYRLAMDSVVTDDLRHRTAIHFLVNMLEAYYLAHADAINSALGLSLRDHDGDVEDIRNPKGYLKEVFPGFNEISDGQKIVKLLDMEHVLSNPDTCTSLRALFKWCILARRGKLTDRFQALSGKCSPVTEHQITTLT